MLKNIIQLKTYICNTFYNLLRIVSSAVKTAITCDKQEISKKLVRDISDLVLSKITLA